MLKLRCSLSVIGFKEKALKVWGLKEWGGATDKETKTVLFFGMYTLHDYDAWWYLPENIHRIVFWCGSDILNLISFSEFQRRIKLYPNAEHYCETKEEYDNLKGVGIEAKILPSFLEDTKDFKLCYKPSETPHIWMCAHPGREMEYGVDIAIRMAKKLPEFTFHIYGIFDWLEEEHPKNILYHGQVANDQLNKEIQEYQCGLRCNKHEGFSEVPVKAILNGQYAITQMPFEKIWNFKNEEELELLLKSLKGKRDWNKEGYYWWSKRLNNFPWIKK